MKKSYLLLSLAVLVALLLPMQSAHAKRPKPTPKADTHTVIENVSADSITVKEPKETKTYKITKFTEISYNGQSAKITDLKSGMRVEVSSGDPGVAERIAATEAPKK